MGVSVTALDGVDAWRLRDGGRENGGVEVGAADGGEGVNSKDEEGDAMLTSNGGGMTVAGEVSTVASCLVCR